MSDISVALTTSAHVIVGDNLPDKFTDLCIPICCAQVGLGMFGFLGSEKERQELVFGEICKNMAKEVYVDTEKRWVFIGENHNDPQTGLIDYTEQDYRICAQDFFKYWDKYHCLMLEFRVFNPMHGADKDLTLDPLMGSGRAVLPEDSDLFCLKGIWMLNHWKSLDVYPTSRITIIPGDPSKTV